MKINELLTVVIPTHTNLLRETDKLISVVIDNLFNMLDINDCDIIVSCDLLNEEKVPHFIDRIKGDINIKHIDCNKRNEEYTDHISDLNTKTNNKIKLLTTKGTSTGNQRQSFVNAINEVKTPYYLFIESDRVFKYPVNLGLLLNIMNKYEFVKYLSFLDVGMSKHIERARKNGTRCVIEDRVKEIDIFNAFTYMNASYIAKKNWWTNVCVPVLKNEDEPKEIHHQVESPIRHQMWRDLDDCGDDFVQNKWGTYIYINKKAMVLHLNN